MEPKYIGPPDLHDGRVLSASEPVHGELQVHVVGATGSRYLVSFSGVSLLQADYDLQAALNEAKAAKRRVKRLA